MNRFIFRLLCVALLLAGQQAALTHALAHAQDRLARSTATQAADTGDASDGTQGERYALCDFDVAYSQVLGAVHSAGIAPLLLEASFVAFASDGTSRTAATELPFLIRGPPRLL